MSHSLELRASSPLGESRWLWWGPTNRGIGAGASCGWQRGGGFGGLHADFTGDGLVTTSDLTFIINPGHFLSLGEDEAGSIAGGRQPRKRATVRELLMKGVREAAKMDGNNDGWVTVEEIRSWLVKR